MNIKLSEITHLSNLSRLTLTDSETKQFAHDISDIVGFVHTLHSCKSVSNKIDGRMNMTYSNTTRGDSLSLKKKGEEKRIIDQFPVKQDRSLKIPPVF